jgi:hypothetical protein
LPSGGEGCEVDHQGRSQETGGQRVAVGIHSEVDDLATDERPLKVDLLAVAESRIEAAAKLAFGEDREPVAPARRSERAPASRPST